MRMVKMAVGLECIPAYTNDFSRARTYGCHDKDARSRRSVN